MNVESMTDRLQRQLRAREGEQQRIAREAGVAQATISRIISGKTTPRLDTAEKLMAWLKANGRRRSRKTNEPAGK